MSSPARDVLVVGAGPAGLATAAELQRRRIPYRLIERGPTIAHVWEHLYDSLTLHTGRHMSTLPGLRYPAGTSLFPTRLEFLDYLKRFARERSIDAEVNRELRSLARAGDRWIATMADGEVREATHVVMTTGIVTRPRMPTLPGQGEFRGTLLHSASYRRPGPFAGQRVLVVGVGNSGGEIGGELARSGATVTVAVRSGANVVPRQVGPFPAQYVRYWVGKLPRAVQEVVLERVQARTRKRLGGEVLPRAKVSVLDAIPLIGFTLVDAIREGLVEVRRAGVASFTPTGVRFTDGSTGEYDAVIMATGFEPAIDALGAQVRRDAKGFAVRTDRVTSADQPNLWFVGHNYDHTGGLTNIRIDAPLVADAIASR